MAWAVTGVRTTIVRELQKLTGELMIRLDMDTSDIAAPLPALPDVDYFVLAAGVLHGKRVLDLTADEIASCVSVNFVNVLRLCEHIFANHPRAQVCIIGSESAWKGSFDQLYAATKAAVHSYVKTRRSLGPLQRLVAVAPPIIRDSGMTQRRGDLEQLMRSGRKMCSARDVARRVYGSMRDGVHQNEVLSL